MSDTDLSSLDDFRYYAFISYSHKDSRWADRLHRALETYRVPKALHDLTDHHTKLPKRIFPVFKDAEELPSSHNLSASISLALEQSRFLIVICSPHSAKSRWVNEEIKAFKALGREDRILCLIVDGAPNAVTLGNGTTNECFPKALRLPLDLGKHSLDNRLEPLAADARPGHGGRKTALLKLIAGILGVNFDALRERDQKRRLRRVQSIAGAALLLAGALTMLSLNLFNARNTIETRLVEAYRNQGISANIEGDHQRALLYFEAIRDLVGDDPIVQIAHSDSWAQLEPLVLEIDGDGTAIEFIEFNSDSTAVFVKSESGVIRRVDISTGELTDFSSTRYLIPGRALSRFGERIVTLSRQTDPADANRVIRSINVADQTGRVTAQLPWPRELPNPDRLIISDDGKVVLIVINSVVGDHLVQTWHVDTNPQVTAQLVPDESPGNVRYSLSDDGRYVAITAYTGDSDFWIELRDTNSLSLKGRVALPTRPESVLFLPPLNGEDSFVVGMVNGQIQNYSITGELPLNWSQNPWEYADQVESLSLAPSNDRFLAATSLGFAAEFDVQSGEILSYVQERFDDVLYASAYSPNGDVGIISGKTVSVAAQQAEDDPSNVMTFDFSKTWIGTFGQTVAFSGDGALVGVGSKDGTLRVWNFSGTEAEALTRKIYAEDENSLASVSPIGAGQYILAGSAFHSFRAGDEAPVFLGPVRAFSSAVALHHDVIGYAGGGLEMVNLSTGAETWHPSLQISVSSIIEANPVEGAVAIIAALPGGSLMGFGADGVALPSFYSGDGLASNPSDIWIDSNGRIVVAGFNDARIAIGQLGGVGITDVILANLPGSPPVFLTGTSQHILAKNSDGIWHLQATSGNITALDLGDLAAVEVFTLSGTTYVISVSKQGMPSLYDLDGQLLKQGQFVGAPIEKPLLSSSSDEVGEHVAVHINPKTQTGILASSLNHAVYIWRLPDLQLLWRSPPLSGGTSFSGGLSIFGFDETGLRLLVGFSNPVLGISGLAELVIPNHVPTSTQAQDYLNNVARIKLDDTGHVFPR